MERNEAVLRELNLYPLWVQRNRPAPVELRALSPVPPAEPAAATAAPPDWLQLGLKVRECTACNLRRSCTQTVFGAGDAAADWLLLGAAPDAEEDRLGEPLAGLPGKLLDNMLLALGLQRGKNVYICNVVKCRPPTDRAPTSTEIETCLPYLRRQIELIRPRLIVALGQTAACALLGQDSPLEALRGTVHDYCGIKVIATFNPAYLLLSPPEKAKAWQDLRLAAETMQKASRAAR